MKIGHFIFSFYAKCPIFIALECVLHWYFRNISTRDKKSQEEI